ncbi:hypothetical protein COCCADRAFT_36671 [Bipolaris zeicola 26-R-13]|uniref:Uncharacterized protein n=1 Tax=Cochliobolus carbonum (strain 26-R-13) TaxID=930089 RepID=W6Y1C4_COCC2|nr:uncharacterized protein COCCADRAFT_36671 [Bipolaris zeicola 26-R-13]EUC33557.1 hypothetical protein COCCADRAFT_36671 [Bipolaris zeicola 26-R-13]
MEKVESCLDPETWTADDCRRKLTSQSQSRQPQMCIYAPKHQNMMLQNASRPAPRTPCTCSQSMNHDKEKFLCWTEQLGRHTQQSILRPPTVND